VQDAGLIFLSAIASTVATQLRGEFPDDEVIATCVCTLALGTSMLGVALVITVSGAIAKCASFLLLFSHTIFFRF
jgi:SulP family sulfate permease